MANNSAHLVSMNGEYLFLSADDAKYAPLRINEQIAQKIQRTIETENPGPDSCIQTISSTWCSGKFVLTTSFRATTKCASCFKEPSTRTKNEMCLRKMCNGNCTDTFMRNVVAKNVFPDLYNTNQK